jgi:hypothetical protein
MAKLNKTKATAASKADSASFEPVPDAVYHVRLEDVDSSREGPKGPYWSWQFVIVEDGEAKGRKLWNNTSLSDAAMFKFKESFDAFGVETDTDTDDIIGQVCRAVVSTRTIQQGDRKGEQANQIDRLTPADSEFAEAEEEDIFA